MQPVRTCVGCRGRATRLELLRVVAEGDRIVPDRQARLPGRGAHLHPRLDCLVAAERRRAFGRALRLTGPGDTAAVRRYLEQPPITSMSQPNP